MSRRLILTNDQVNRYGYRIDSRGVSLAAYEKNPVLLYMHDREGKLPVGRIEDIKLEADPDNKGDFMLTGAPVFDTESGDKFAAMVASKYENRFLNAASIQISPLVFSEDPEDLKEGQKGETIAKSILNEISMATVGGNSDAVGLSAPRLFLEGKELGLSPNQEDVDKIVPLLKTSNSKNPNMKKLALALGLKADANEEQILSKIEEMQSEDKSLSLEKTKETLESGLVGLALSLGVVEETDKGDFEELLEASPKLAIKQIDKALSLKEKAAPEAKETPEDKKSETEKKQDKALAHIIDESNKEPENKVEKETEAKELSFKDMDPDALRDLKKSDPKKYELKLNAYLDSLPKGDERHIEA